MIPAKHASSGSGNARFVKITEQRADCAGVNCAACGAAMTPDAAWCTQCFQPRSSAAASSTAVLAPGAWAGTSAGTSTGLPGLTRPVPVAAPPPPPVQRSRWRKTQTTFGPVGRVVSTVLLVVPFLIMLVGGLIGDFFALGGAAIWLIVIMPWGLRDVWKAGQVLPSR